MEHKIGLEVVGTLDVPVKKENILEKDIVDIFKKVISDKKYIGDLSEVEFSIYQIDKEKHLISYGITGNMWVSNSLEEQLKLNWFLEDSHVWTNATKKIIHKDFGKIKHLYFNNIIEKKIA